MGYTEEVATEPVFDKDKRQRELRTLDIPLGVYEHYKGGLYTVFALSVQEESGEVLVHYYSHVKKTRWTRTWQNFGSVIFIPQGVSVPRFRFVRNVTGEGLLDALDHGIT